MNASTARLLVAGPAGQLEVLRDDPVLSAGQALRGVAVVAHPHPVYGGTMDNKVVQTLARAFVHCGWRAIRFNFRGVGQSAGSYDEGLGEVQDLRAVLDACGQDGDLALAGFSFGSFVVSMALEQMPDQSRVRRLVMVGTAATRFPVAAIPAGLNPLVVHGELDETVPLSDVLRWARPQNLPVVVIPGASHFFHGQLGLLKTLVVRHLNVPD